MPRELLQNTPLGRVRISSLDDAPFILELVNESVSKNFRINDVEEITYLIDNSVLSICQLDINEKILGFLSVKDYPFVPSIHPCAWEDYIWTKYKSIEMNSRNTLFIHMMCWNLAYARELVENMLRTVFMHDQYLHHIAMIKSLKQFPLLVPGQSRSEAMFRRVHAIERGLSDEVSTLCVADRDEICPKLRIRRAVEEDNDDIVPIIERHSERLHDLYGEFYVSELISRHPESERVLLVCEHKELAVGVMCLNTQINYESLEQNYELSPYAGLRHQSQPKVASNGSLSDVSAFDSDEGEVIEVESGVITEFNKSEIIENGEREPKEMLNKTEEGYNLHIISLLEDDENEIEYDIVNIDNELLKTAHISIDFIACGANDEGKKSVAKDSATNLNYRIKMREKINGSSISALVEQRRYAGEPNAFMIELFAMHTEYDERYGFDTLQGAFELFPDREYCIICLPTDRISFPLLDHFTLVTPFACNQRFINQSLYVAHINSIRGDMRVRRGEMYDLPAVNVVLNNAPQKSALMELFKSSTTTSSLESFVVLSQDTVVGAVVLGPFEDAISVRTHYNLISEPRRSGTDGVILGGVISPLFEPHSRWFLRELLRHTRYTTLFWICHTYSKGIEQNPRRNLMSLNSQMVPVRPRQRPLNLSSDNVLEKIEANLSLPFAVWQIERSLTSLPKVNVNSSIVVVGCSRTALAFIERLIFGPTSSYLTFTNVALVSAYGLPMMTDVMKAAETCVPHEGRYSEKYLKSMPFCFYIDVISSVMVEIDRKKKCIRTKCGGVKYYDELVLACGNQFQHPEYMKESLDVAKELEKGKPCERMLMDDPQYRPDQLPQPPDVPENLFIINSLYEANQHLKKLLKMINNTKDVHEKLGVNNSVVVYGDCIEAYTCMAALLEMGISSKNITFIEPFPSENPNAMRINCFNDEKIDETVQESLVKLDVRVLRECRMVGWTLAGKRVTRLKLMTPLHAFDLNIFALFYYGLKAIDLNAFKAINVSGLVYDGGLVIDTWFGTNDPHIYGAGTCTRYSRRYYAERHIHKHYRSEQIGEELAELFLSRLDPFKANDPLNVRRSTDFISPCSSSLNVNKSTSHRNDASNAEQNTWQPVKKFDLPLTLHAVLPGPLYYVKIRKPGPEIPMEVQKSLTPQGHTLVTDNCGNYFRLELNLLHCVSAITCLSKEKYYPEIVERLYGKHEAFFDKLLYRYENKQITDLFEYFTQSWLGVLYQEQFEDLMQEINDKEIGTIYDVLKSKAHLSEQPASEIQKKASYISCFHQTDSKHSPKECGQSKAARNMVSELWQALGGGDIVESYLSRYLAKNSIINSSYAVPGIFNPDVVP